MCMPPGASTQALTGEVAVPGGAAGQDSGRGFSLQGFPSPAISDTEVSTVRGQLTET